jgi:ATP-dependent Clp protease ATP-binding subunit ClpC
MFTERARRVIFLARFEASEYGRPCIGTEHLLLGLLREDRALMQRLLGTTDFESEIRKEIEAQIIRRERIDTAVEMPLTAESKNILNYAAEDAERLEHRHIGTEHLLLGILRMEGSLAAQILQGRGLKLAEIREQLPKIAGGTIKTQRQTSALAKLEDFLSGLKRYGSEELLPFFAKNANFVDATGKVRNREEIGKHLKLYLFCTLKKTQPM